MCLLSIDVGIRNLAYCMFDGSGNVVDWNILNLMGVEPVAQLCKEIQINKNVCGHKTNYEKDGKNYCNKHAKNSGFIMPTPKLSSTNLKKQKIGQLKQIATSLHIPIPGEDTRLTILTKITDFLSENGLTQIKFKKANAGLADLIHIGRELKRQMDDKPHFHNITRVVIENQISPIATRMKTIQGMIAQYFIMRNDAIVIEFVSSAGKLKGFEKQNTDITSEYSQHKKDAVFYCKQFIATEKYEKWQYMMETKKKDDLADCFLQGICALPKN